MMKIIFISIMIFTALISLAAFYMEAKKYDDTPAAKKAPVAKKDMRHIIALLVSLVAFFTIVMLVPTKYIEDNDDAFIAAILTAPGVGAIITMALSEAARTYLKSKLRSAPIAIGDLNDFDDPPARRKKKKRPQRRQPRSNYSYSSKKKSPQRRQPRSSSSYSSKKKSPQRRQPRSSSSYPYSQNSRRETPRKDTSPARLLILSDALPFENVDLEDFDPDDLTFADVFSESDVVRNFNNVDAAKAYLNTLDFGDVIIMSDHTVVMSFNGFRTKRNFAIANAIAHYYSHKNTSGKDCTIVSSRHHYVEFTYGLGKDTDYYHDLSNALLACLDSDD